MRTISVGIDICNIARVQNIVEIYNMRFIERISHSDELEYINTSHHSKRALTVASNFCIKEATIKAIGLRDFIEPVLVMSDIIIMRNIAGRPSIAFTERIRSSLHGMYGRFDFLVTNSHDCGIAVSCVIFNVLD